MTMELNCYIYHERIWHQKTPLILPNTKYITQTLSLPQQLLGWSYFMGTHISITQPINCHASLHRTLWELLCGQVKNKWDAWHQSWIWNFVKPPKWHQLLAPNAPYYNNDEYSKNDPNKNKQFEFDNDMENLDLSQSLYGDLNAIPNSTTIA